MFGSTLDNGVISAPASAPSPAPRPKVVKRMRSALMPRPRARSSFMITARVRTPKRVPFSSSVMAATDTAPWLGESPNCTARPNATVMSGPITMPSPHVARIASSGRLYSGCTIRRSTPMPTSTPTANANGRATQGFRPNCVTTRLA
ncbi:hypothetical protein G6F57_021772 [Rhizopus arrhizus]|nr:hypothetical protein G6F57_021772 [Rhizopus arrhizus]